jgi:hypothetical protein
MRLQSVTVFLALFLLAQSATAAAFNIPEKGKILYSRKVVIEKRDNQGNDNQRNDGPEFGGNPDGPHC